MTKEQFTRDLAFLRLHSHRAPLVPKGNNAFFGMHYADVHLRTFDRTGVLYEPSTRLWQNCEQKHLLASNASVILLEDALGHEEFRNFNHGVNWYVPTKTEDGKVYWRSAHEQPDILPFSVKGKLPSGLYVPRPEVIAEARYASAAAQCDAPEHLRISAKAAFRREIINSMRKELPEWLQDSREFGGMLTPFRGVSSPVSMRATQGTIIRGLEPLTITPHSKQELAYFRKHAGAYNGP